MVLDCFFSTHNAARVGAAGSQPRRPGPKNVARCTLSFLLGLLRRTIIARKRVAKKNFH